MTNERKYRVPMTDHNEHFWAAVWRLFKRRFPLALGGVLTIGLILGTARLYWCADNATTFGSARASVDEWRSMLDAGFVHHTVGNMIFI